VGLASDNKSQSNISYRLKSNSAAAAKAGSKTAKKTKKTEAM